MWLKALRNSFDKFQEFFERSTKLTEKARDKIFLIIFNLYFFNQSRGIQVDFSATFHLVIVPDFAGVFLAMVVTA